MSSWYWGSSHPLYFDMLCEDSTLHRFQIALNPDLSSASLHFKTTSELSHDDFRHVMIHHDYRICEDALYACWLYDTFHSWWNHHPEDGYDDSQDRYQCGLYIGLEFTRFSVSYEDPAGNVLLPRNGGGFRLLSCPASCRFVVLLDKENSLVVSDY